jgi:hypothetical protein
MDPSIEASTPILVLRQDVLNFLEAIDPQPNSELNITGYKFAMLLNELNDSYQMEYAIEHMESCFHCPEFIKPYDMK